MKEIIIDGVNVAGCAYITYRDSENPICSETGQYCKGYDICYYKQLKRIEQENEKLKEEIKQLTEWKRKSVTCQECYDEGVATADIKINRYKQTLEEIREIANAIIDGKHITNDIEGHLKELSKLIQDKVNEVLK